MNDNMKDFLGDLGKRIGETAETVTSKAGDVIEIQRLKSQIRELARGNAVDLMELGRKIYDRYQAGEKVEESAEALCDAIKSREESIAGYEKKISRIKGASECPGCGKMVAKEMAYCPYCGEKVVWDMEPEEEETEEAEPETAADDGAGSEKPEADAADAAEDGPDKAEKPESEVTGDVKDSTLHEYADAMKEKAADAAEYASDKMGKAADKAVVMADKAIDKAEEMAGKAEGMAERAADKMEEMADKAMDKAGKAADKAAEKTSSAAEKAADKINGR